MDSDPDPGPGRYNGCRHHGHVERQRNGYGSTLDGHANWHADPNGDTFHDSHLYTDFNADAGRYAVTHRNTYRHADSDSDEYTDGYAHEYGDVYALMDTHRYAHPHRHKYGDTDSHAVTHADRYFYSNTHAGYRGRDNTGRNKRKTGRVDAGD